MPSKKIAAYAILVVGVVFAFLVFGAFAHGATTKNRPNSLGIEEVYSNPNTYLLALPLDGQVLDGATSVWFQPFATAALYDEDVLFCGDVTGYFADKKGPVVVTYDRIAHKLYHGVACHDIKAVFEVKGGKP